MKLRVTARTHFLFLFFSFLAVQAYAQDTCSTITLPVVATVNGRTVLGLDADVFKVSLHKHPISLDSFTANEQPSRVLIILSNDLNLSFEDRRLAVSAVEALIEKASATDDFALVSEFNHERVISFGKSREQLRKALLEIEGELKDRGKTSGVFDALLTGVRMFPDSSNLNVVLFMGTEFHDSKSHAHFEDVNRELVAHQARLFGVQFGPILAGTYLGPANLFSSQPSGQQWGFLMEERNLLSLSIRSGGFIFEAADDPWRQLKYSDSTAKDMQNSLWNQYHAATHDYLLTFKRPAGTWKPNDWRIDLDESIVKQLPKIKLAFPREIPPCKS